MPVHRSRPDHRSARCGRAALAAVAIGVLVLAGCSGSEPDDASAPGTTGTAPVATTVAPTTTSSSTTTSTTEAPTTTAPSTTSTSTPQGPASSLPPLPSGDVAAVCGVLAQTIPVGDLAPLDSGDWTQEQRRVGVDASLDASLFGQAAGAAPAAVAGALQTQQAYAQWVADTVASATSYAQASQAIAGYPDRAAVDAAAATTDSWQRTNC